MQSEFGEIEEDEIIEEFFDETASSPQQQKYMEENGIDKNIPGTYLTQEEHEEDINNEQNSLIQNGQIAIKPEISTIKKNEKGRTEIIEYEVKSGDTISTIANEFGISVNTILWENNLDSHSLIRPEEKLSILPTTGITYKVINGDTIGKIAIDYGIDEAEILEANKEIKNNKISIGEKLIIPGGKKLVYTTPIAKSYSGISAIKDLISPPSAKPAASNKMNWPTEGNRITQYYSWRHLGLDIANKTGTPLYAADAGTVELAGWNNGYGNNIIVNHGGGKKTRYAHLSKFYVKKGDKVGKGETIGAMGSTGWSTGPHLHFEVIINGKKYNPLNYIK